MTRESAEVDRERAARWQGKRRRERQAQLDRRIEAVRRGEVYVPAPAAVPALGAASVARYVSASVYPGGSPGVSVAYPSVPVEERGWRRRRRHVSVGTICL